ncbi:MAG: glycosyltransferase [Pseudomonadota bacterium]
MKYVSEIKALSVAAVVPAYNAAGYIRRCIDGLIAAGFRPDQISIADDGSTDSTIEIVREYGIEPIVLSANLGAAGARNAAAQAVGADILLFVDADVIVHPDVCERILDRFTQPDAPSAIFGSYDDKPTRSEPISRVRNLLHHYVHQKNGGAATTFWTGLGAVRRDVFDEVGGFDASVAMMEDIEFGMRLHLAGHRIELDPALQGSHQKYWSLPGMVQTDLWHRAVPWTQLMSSPAGQRIPESLNVSLDSKASVILVGLSMIFAALAWVIGLSAAIACGITIAALVYFNREFLAFVTRLDGVRQAAKALGVLWLHYLCAGTGYALVKMRLV